MSHTSIPAVSSEQLRLLVREVLRDVLPTLGASKAPEIEKVSLRNDAELAEFVRHLIQMLDHPAHGASIRNGNYRFALSDTSPGVLTAGSSVSPAASPLCKTTIQDGLLTEAKMNQYKGTVERLLLNESVVITPGARDRARQLGITLERIKA